MIYETGDGVIQNNVSAHMWFNLQNANGINDAKNQRDFVADRMTSAQFAEAQARASKCLESNYQDCD